VLLQKKRRPFGSPFQYHKQRPKGRCFCSKRRPLGRRSSTLSSGPCFCGERRPLGCRSSIPSSGRKATASAVNGNLWVAVPVVAVSSGLLATASLVHQGRRGRQSGGLSWPPHKGQHMWVAAAGARRGARVSSGQNQKLTDQKIIPILDFRIGS
jgi:hypothetical protein